jgi:hypothetical protein
MRNPKFADLFKKPDTSGNTLDTSQFGEANKPYVDYIINAYRRGGGLYAVDPTADLVNAFLKTLNDPAFQEHLKKTGGWQSYVDEEIQKWRPENDPRSAKLAEQMAKAKQGEILLAQILNQGGNRQYTIPTQLAARQLQLQGQAQQLGAIFNTIGAQQDLVRALGGMGYEGLMKLFPLLRSGGGWASIFQGLLGAGASISKFLLSDKGMKKNIRRLGPSDIDWIFDAPVKKTTGQVTPVEAGELIGTIVGAIQHQQRQLDQLRRGT